MRSVQRLNKLSCLVPGLVHPRCSGSLLSLFAASPTVPSAGLHSPKALRSCLLVSRTETIFQKTIDCPSPHCVVGPVCLQNHITSFFPCSTAFLKSVHHVLNLFHAPLQLEADHSPLFHSLSVQYSMTNNMVVMIMIKMMVVIVEMAVVVVNFHWTYSVPLSYFLYSFLYPILIIAIWSILLLK